MNRRSPRAALFAAFILFGASMVACPFFGPAPLDWNAVFRAPLEGDGLVFFSVRLPRVLMALLAGAALSVSGAVFQAVLRNPLACPYTLGVAGGASLGAVAAFAWALPASFAGIPTVTLTSFAGALLSALLVFGLASIRRSYSSTLLILAGITANFLFNALIMILYYLSDFTQGAAMLHWMLGGLDGSDMGSFRIAASALALPALILLFIPRELDLLAAGDDMASSKGVPAQKLALVALGAASLATGAVVSMTGPIGFVGLLVPHALRPFTGTSHRFLLPASALLGGAFLAICDTLARTIFSPAELPVGVVTALLGGPFFLLLLVRLQRLRF